MLRSSVHRRVVKMQDFHPLNPSSWSAVSHMKGIWLIAPMHQKSPTLQGRVRAFITVKCSLLEGPFWDIWVSQSFSLGVYADLSPAPMSIQVCLRACSMLRLNNDGRIQVTLTSNSYRHTAPSSLVNAGSNSTSGSQLSSPALPTTSTPASSARHIYNAAGQKGFLDGVFGCLRPVLSFIGKATAAELKHQGQSPAQQLLAVLVTEV